MFLDTKSGDAIRYKRSILAEVVASKVDANSALNASWNENTFSFATDAYAAHEAAMNASRAKLASIQHLRA